MMFLEPFTFVIDCRIFFFVHAQEGDIFIAPSGDAGSISINEVFNLMQKCLADLSPLSG